MSLPLSLLRQLETAPPAEAWTILFEQTWQTCAAGLAKNGASTRRRAPREEGQLLTEAGTRVGRDPTRSMDESGLASSAMTQSRPRFGLPFWGFEGWHGSLYTEEVRQTASLAQYARVFDAVEGNRALQLELGRIHVD